MERLFKKHFTKLFTKRTTFFRSFSIRNAFGRLDKFNGFTIAEVLITLGIIGVVAAMTLPTLLSKYKDKILVSQAKKLYYETLNSIKMYMSKNDCTNASCLFDTSKSTDEVNREFFKMFEGATYCEQGNQKPLCQKYMVLGNKPKNNGYGETGYSDNISQPFILLKTGAVIKFVQYSECVRETVTNKRDENGNYIIGPDGKPQTETRTTDACAYIYIDSNGPKAPNQSGADIFQLTFKSDNKIHNNIYLTRILTEDRVEYTPYRTGVKY